MILLAKFFNKQIHQILFLVDLSGRTPISSLLLFHQNFKKAFTYYGMKKLVSLYNKIKNLLIIHLKGKEHFARSKGAKIGENCSIRTKYFGTEPYLIEIGDNVTIAADVKLITHDGSGSLFGRRFRYRKIIIGNNVFIGMNSIVLLGVKVGDNVIVGAGSVLTKSIPSNSVVAGNPANIIMTYEEYAARYKDIVPKKTDTIEGDFEEQVYRTLDQSMRPKLSTTEKPIE